MELIVARAPLLIASLVVVGVLVWRGISWRRAVLSVVLIHALLLASVLWYSWFVWQPVTP